MIVDSTHKPWLFGTAAGAAAVLVAYLVSLSFSASKPGGGTPLGLACGFAGAAVIVFGCLLGARKRLPTLRVGRTHTWLKAHVWLGILGFTTILFHSGFSLGGPLSTVLMLLFALITLSGIAGVLLQQFIPKMMMDQLQEEAIFEQMDAVLKDLRDSADRLVQSLALQPKEAPGAGTEAGDHMTAAHSHSVLDELYAREIRPYLYDEKRPEILASAKKSHILFTHIRKLFPPSASEPLGQLEKLVERRRQLAVQAKLHYVLHGWLLVHVPLSAALLVLMFVHAWMALRLT